MSTQGDTKMHVGGYDEYTGVCSVHWRDIMSTPEGYHEYTRGIPRVHWGILVRMRKDYYQISRIFVLASFATM